MTQIYLDNAATTFPKPPFVPQAVYNYMTTCGSNINRGSYNSAYNAEALVFETRELLTELFHGEDPSQVIFTKNITESLNVILKGLLKSGDHVIVSSMEHNAVMRPLNQLTTQGVTYSRITCQSDGTLPLEKLHETVNENTRAVIMTHASNVCGTILPVQEVGEFCHKHNLLFILDTAQSAGLLPINMEEMHIDALAFTGHKGLLGPQGIGGFILKRDLNLKIEPLLSGGTGSFSHTEDVPLIMPDRFEAGTLNIPGIMGLREGLLFLKEKGIENIYRHEMALTEHFLNDLLPLENEGLIKIIGKKDIQNRVGVISIQSMKMDPAEVSYILDDKYGIMTRVGLHCAPSAHKTLGTFPTGTIRFSFGYFNTDDEVDCALAALKEVLYGI